MKLLKYPLKAIDGIADRIFAVVGAITVSQVPGYILHYLQRLGGHVDEARRNVAGWQKIADKTTSGSIDKLIHNYSGSDAAEVLEAGRKCAGDVARLDELQSALDAITNSSAWARPFTFMRHMDVEISRAVLDTYTPNAPLDLPSIVYAVVGLILAVLIYKGLKLGCRACFQKLSRKRTSANASADSVEESAGGEQ